MQHGFLSQTFSDILDQGYIESSIHILHSIREYTYETDFTPYMHVFIFHSGFFLRKYGSLLPFTMESVELMNRKNKLVFFSATDHGREDGISDQVSWN